ncbi:MAG: hypothetical protein RLZZ254_1164 [Actinomycetota bacterium]|jgi:hypothetical protein
MPSEDIETRRATPRVVPDGIIANRALVRSRGAVTAAGFAAAIALAGVVLLALPGSLTGILGFLLLIAALPTLPMFGVPAVTGVTVYLLGVVTSLGAWFAIGHLAALRASKRAVVDWSDWRREFIPLALGLLLGGVLALIIGGLVLGAL